MKTCPACHQLYSDNVDSCPRDGSRLVAEVRDERECPYCAEKILKKARFCKHCRRDVEPLTAGDTPVQIPLPAPHGTGEIWSPQPQASKPATAGACSTDGGKPEAPAPFLTPAVPQKIVESRTPEPEASTSLAVGRPPTAARAPWLRAEPMAPSRMKCVMAGLRGGRFRPMLLAVVSVFAVSAVVVGVIWFHHARSPLFLVRENFKWGYIDRAGKRVIQPQFDEATGFEKGLALVHSSVRWGYIDTTGKYVIKPQFDEAFQFSEGFARVRSGQKWGYIDRAGKYLIGPKFKYAWKFSEGLARVDVEGKVGYIDRAGTMVIAPHFDAANDFHEGLAVVKTNGKLGYIGREGNYVISPHFDDSGDFSSNGLAPAKVGDKWGYINKAGSFVVPPQYTLAITFENGYAGIILGEKWGLLDNKGRVSLKPQYEQLAIYSCGLAAVKLDGKWGYADEKGTVVLKPQYDVVSNFSENLAAARVNGKWGYIDKTGKFVIEPRFSEAENFINGLAYVDYGTSVISTNGTAVWNASPTSFEGTFFKQVLPLMEPYLEPYLPRVSAGQIHLEWEWNLCYGGTLKNAPCFIVSTGKPEELASSLYRDGSIAAKMASLGFDGLLFEEHLTDADPHTFHFLFGMRPTANGWEPLPGAGLPPFLETADYYFQRGIALQSTGDLTVAKTWFEAVVAKFPTSNLVASAQERLAAVNEAIAKAEAERAAEVQRQQEERERQADEPTPAELDCVCRDIRNSGVRCDDPHDAYDFARHAKHAARMTGLPLCSER